MRLQSGRIPTGEFLCITQGPFCRPTPPLRKHPSPNQEVYLNWRQSAPVRSLERAAGELTLGDTMTIHIKYIFIKFPQQLVAGLYNGDL